MTPEQKIITIAEFDGIQKQKCSRIGGCFYELGISGPCKCDTDELEIPSYLTSRDAVCGAMAKLDAHQGAEFVSHLAKVQGWTYQHESTFSDSIFSLITAKPAQLADALLLTLGHEI